MKTDSTETNSTKSELGMASRVLLIASIVALVATVVGRWIALEYDGGIASFVTLILGFLFWLLAAGGLWLSPWSRAMPLVWTFAPFVVIGLTLMQYRIKRFDGVLVPQFESRWAEKAALPQAAKDNSAKTDNSSLIPAEKFAVSATDFPQFLGKERSGVIGDVQLDSNWTTKPPEVLWKQPIGAGWSGFAVQGDVAVTLEQRDEEQWVSAYDVLSGQLYWNVGFPGSHFNVLGGAGPRATPAIADNVVFAQTATGQVSAIELGTGKLIWQADLLKIGGWDQSASELAISWGRSGSPLVVGDLVIVPLGAPNGTEDRGLIAFDKKSGDVRWRSGADQISYSSPSLTRLLDKEQIVMVNEATVTGHEIETGKVLWTVPWDGHSNSSANCSQTIMISPTQMLISKGYTQGAKLVEFALNADDQSWTSKTIWESTSVLKTKFTSAVVLGEYAYALSDGLLECTRVADGKRQWRGRGYGHGQLLLAGDNLLIMAEQGDVALVGAQPKEFKQLSRLPVLKGVTWNVPSLSGDRLLLRNSDEAACLKLPLK